MSFEDQVRSSVGEALGTLVKQAIDYAAEEPAMAANEIRRETEAVVEEREAVAVAAGESRIPTALDAGEDRAAAVMNHAASPGLTRERDHERGAVARLLDGIRGLDRASSLSDVLDVLALEAAREAARAAVVVLSGDRIQGWKMSGFGPLDLQPKSIDLAIGESGVIGLAVGAAQAVTAGDGQDTAAGPGFEKLAADRTGLAVPVIVGGRVVSVVYAEGVPLDGRDGPGQSEWRDAIEVLARHAGRCLEALTTLRRAEAPLRVQPPSVVATVPEPASVPSPGKSPLAGLSQITTGVAEAAKRTARLLVAEIRLFHEPAVHQGRRDRNLMELLAPEIEKARKAYDERVPATVRSQTDYFQEELVRTLAGGDPTLLGNTVRD